MASAKSGASSEATQRQRDERQGKAGQSKREIPHRISVQKVGSLIESAFKECESLPNQQSQWSEYSLKILRLRVLLSLREEFEP